MNKVTRFIGSTVLATGLAFSGAALTAGAASANDSNHSSYNNDRSDRDGRHDDRDSRHNDYKYVYICFDRRDHHRWYTVRTNKYEYKWNCYLLDGRH